MNWHQISAEKANEMIAMNKEGKKPAALEDYVVETVPQEKEPYSNVVGQDSLTRFDQPKTRKKARKTKPRSNTRNRKPQKND